MNTGNLRILAIIIAVLIGLYFVSAERPDDRGQGNAFLPGLGAQLDEIGSLSIRSNSSNFTIARGESSWGISERDGYPADLAKLRAVFRALSEASIAETKTSIADKYSQIGVNDPSEEGSQAVELTISGNDFEHVVLLGKAAQQSYRYARVADNAQSVMIDKNPDVPDQVGGWLVQELLDVSASRVRSVVTEHTDGERIEISKDDPEQSNFDVLNIPDGRELSYESVANGIAGAFAGLNLEDVRRATPDNDAEAVTALETFDGLRLNIELYAAGDESWISIGAESFESTPAPNDDAEGAAANDEAVEPAAATEAANINARASGWQFRVADYKANLLKRRFEDILKSEDTAEDG